MGFQRPPARATFLSYADQDPVDFTAELMALLEPAHTST
jgi:hypothetical protein